MRLLLLILGGLSFAHSSPALAQVGSRGADQSLREPGVPEPPREPGEAAPSEPEEVSAEPSAESSAEVSTEPSAEVGAEPSVEVGVEAVAQIAPPPPPQVAPDVVSPNLDVTSVDPFDELQMVRAAQDRADADREAREELLRNEAEAAARRAEERRLQRENERDIREHEETIQHLRVLEERINSRSEQIEPLAPTIVVDESGLFAEELESFVQTFGTDRSFGALLVLLLGILLAAAVASGVRRVRDGLAPSGILPMLFAFVHLAARLLVVALVVAFIVRFLPPRMSLVLLLVFAGAALAIGWSARDLLPDLIAGIVLAFERRVRPGMWLSSKEFSGQVEHVGLRSSTLRDAQGNDVSVPNRFILGAPIATDSTREREQDVTLRLLGESAPVLRGAIIDAVLGSPWVAPRHRPLVYRDPDEPELWHVRARLLEAHYGVRFEGELLERTEAILEAVSTSRVARASAVEEAHLAQGESASDKDSA